MNHQKSQFSQISFEVDLFCKNYLMNLGRFPGYLPQGRIESEVEKSLLNFELANVSKSKSEVKIGRKCIKLVNNDDQKPSKRKTIPKDKTDILKKWITEHKA